MGRIHGLALVPFAWTMIGADKCTGWGWTSGNGQPSPWDPPAMPYCYTDPPQGCSAYCADVDDVELTSACSNVDAGPRTDDFEATIRAIVNMLTMAGTQICDGTNSGDGVTSGVRTNPCQVGIQPVEWPNQDHSVCMSPPPGCPW